MKSETTRGWRSNAMQIRGIAALVEMLDMIGQEGMDDHAMAKVFCENELEIREMLRHHPMDAGCV